MYSTGDIDENIQKPEIIEFYNMTKRVGDVFDKLSHVSSVFRMFNRRSKHYFFGVVDATALNAYVIHKIKLIDIQISISQQISITVSKKIGRITCHSPWNSLS